MKCPCEECISLAVCINQERIQCPLVWEYLGGGEFNYMRNCYILGIYKAHLFYTMTYDKGIQFVKEKPQANQIIYDRYVAGHPITKKIRHYSMYLLLRALIHVLTAKRYLKGKLKLVYRWRYER